MSLVSSRYLGFLTLALKITYLAFLVLWVGFVVELLPLWLLLLSFLLQLLHPLYLLLSFLLFILPLLCYLLFPRERERERESIQIPPILIFFLRIVTDSIYTEKIKFSPTQNIFHNKELIRWGEFSFNCCKLKVVFSLYWK